MAIYSKCNLIVVVSFETQFDIFISAPYFLSQFNHFYVEEINHFVYSNNFLTVNGKRET